MAESVLDMDESVIQKVECHNYPGNEKGTLFVTSKQRLVWVLTKGFFSKRYEKKWWLRLWPINNVRIENVWGGKIVVIEHIYDNVTTEKRFSGLKEPEKWIGYFLELVKKQKKWYRVEEEVSNLVSANEYTSFIEVYNEMKNIWQEELLSYNEIIPEIIDLLEKYLQKGCIDGFIDKENQRFIHKVAYLQKTEVTSYNIATEFKFDGNAFFIKCPNCGAEKSPGQKSSEVKCNSCGQTYRIPQKLLDRI